MHRLVHIVGEALIEIDAVVEVHAAEVVDRYCERPRYGDEMVHLGELGARIPRADRVAVDAEQVGGGRGAAIAGLPAEPAEAFVEQEGRGPPVVERLLSRDEIGHGDLPSGPGAHPVAGSAQALGQGGGDRWLFGDGERLAQDHPPGGGGG